MNKLILISAGLFFLVGCSSFSKDECSAINWKEMGVKVGSRGESANDHIADAMRTCEKHGVKPNVSEYMSGVEIGRAAYCSSERAYTAGKNGWANTGVCKDAGAFLKEYKKGRKVYLLNQIDENERRLARAQEDVQDAQSNVYSERARGDNKSTSSFAASSLTDAQQDVFAIQTEIRKLDRELMLLGPVE